MVQSASYDPNTYVETNFFGEDDTRSNMIRLVTERFTKIINVPNMKDHGAAGVTGCLKNIAYGDFSNVARSHNREKTNTLSFIGTLANGGAASFAHRAADHGRPARRLAWRPIFRRSQVPVLSQDHRVRHRSCRHRSPAAGCHREQTQSRRRAFHLGSFHGSP